MLFGCSASWSWDECPLAGPRPQPPATVPLRISSHPGPLWRHPANARPIRGLRPHEQRRWDGSRRPVGSKRRRADIEPAVNAGLIRHLRRYRQRSTLRATPVHHRCSRHPRPSRDVFGEGVRIRPKGDLTSWCTGADDAYRSGGTDEGYVALAVMAGSMPPAPPCSGAPTRALRCSPDRVQGWRAAAKGSPSRQRAPESRLRRRHRVSGRLDLRGRSERFSAARDPLDAIVFKVFSGRDVGSAGLPIGLGWRRRRLTGSSQWSEPSPGARSTGVRGYLLIRGGLGHSAWRVRTCVELGVPSTSRLESQLGLRSLPSSPSSLPSPGRELAARPGRVTLRVTLGRSANRLVGGLLIDEFSQFCPEIVITRVASPTGTLWTVAARDFPVVSVAVTIWRCRTSIGCDHDGSDRFRRRAAPVDRDRNPDTRVGGRCGRRHSGSLASTLPHRRNR